MDIGRYRLLSRIGQGGMAEVYRAIAVGPGGFEKEVVVKRILPDLSIDPRFAEMFLDEARIASRLDHPNIVQIHDLGCVDETYFIVMEYVRGMDLSALLEALAPTRPGKPPLEAPVALRIVAEVCRALDYAHRMPGPDGKPLGLVHRDVSPQNVLVSDEGAVKLADFGIARAMQGDAGRTQRGRIKGKARYMSPEQARGAALDARSDVYAAGIVLYELLTARHPYTAGDFAETLVRAATPSIDPPSSVLPLDAEIDALVMHALAPSCGARFSSAAALLEAIETYLHDARLRAGPGEIARAVRQARAGSPARVVSLDEAIAGGLEGGGTAQLGELEVTDGTDRTGLPVYRRTLTGLGDAATADLPAAPVGADAPPLAATVPIARAAHDLEVGAPSAAAPGTIDSPAPRRAAGLALPIAAVLIALALGSAATMIVLGGGTPSSSGAPARETPGRRAVSAPVELGPAGGEVALAVATPPVADSGPAAALPAPIARAEPPAPEPPRAAGTQPRRPERDATDTRPARLDIGARPNWAEVRVDGRAVGTTPVSVTLPPGGHSVVARNPRLGIQQRRRVTLQPGARHRIVFDPF